MEEITPYEMELQLLNIGYARDYLEYLTNDEIERIYINEFADSI